MWSMCILRWSREKLDFIEYIYIEEYNNHYRQNSKFGFIDKEGCYDKDTN